MTRGISSKEEKEQRIDDLCLMSIATLKYIEDLKMYSSTSTKRRVTNMSLSKT
jgi:hypothetical protein